METYVYLVIGLVLGLALGWLIASRRKGSGAADEGTLAGQLIEATTRATMLQQQLDDAKRLNNELNEKEQRRLAEENKILQSLAPMQQNVKNMQDKVAEIERERIDQFNQIKVQLENAQAQAQSLTKNTEALAGALTNNQVRGQWGELTLRRLLEQTGMMPHVDFSEQLTSTNDDGKTIKPDVTINMPDGKFVAVDSKVPFNNYQRAFEISELASKDDEKRRKELLKEHAKDVKKHIDEISKKGYYTGLSSSPEFTILFMPSESLLSVTLEADPGLLEYSFENRVALVSPVSFFSVLKTISYGWRQSAQEATIKEIIDLGVKMHKYVRVVAEHAGSLGKNLNSAVTSFNAFASSLERNLLGATRDLNKKSKNVLDGGKAVPFVSELEETTQIFTKPELTSNPEVDAIEAEVVEDDDK